MLFSRAESEGVIVVVIAAAERGRSSSLVDADAGVEVEVEVSFADANLPFLRRMRNERPRRPSVFAMLSIVGRSGKSCLLFLAVVFCGECRLGRSDCGWVGGGCQSVRGRRKTCV